MRALLHNVSVLVVEDNLMNQKLITRVLDTWGCVYKVANNGEEAVTMTSKTKYDLILMDIHMPVMDGCTAAINIRKNKKNPNQKTPIIALTAAAMMDERTRVLNAGINAFYTKPFSPKELKKEIIEFLQKEGTIVIETPDMSNISISFDYLNEFGGGDTSFIRMMVETFLEEAPKTLETLGQSFQTKEWETVYRSAHSLKPNYMSLGMNVQQEVAIEIEEMVKTENIDEPKMLLLIQQLQRETDASYQLLRDKLNELD